MRNIYRDINIFYFMKLELHCASKFILIFHLTFDTFGNITFNDCIKLYNLNKPKFKKF